MDVQVVDDDDLVLAEISYDPREGRLGVLPSIELEPGAFHLQVLGSDSGDVLETATFFVQDRLRDDPPIAPEGILTAFTRDSRPTDVRYRIDTPVPGIVLSLMSDQLDVIEPATDTFYGEVEGFEIGDDLCLDIAFRTAASDYTEAVEVCTTVEENTNQGGDRGIPLPVNCGCSLAGSPASGGFLGLALLGMLLRRRHTA